MRNCSRMTRCSSCSRCWPCDRSGPRPQNAGQMRSKGALPRHFWTICCMLLCCGHNVGPCKWLSHCLYVRLHVPASAHDTWCACNCNTNSSKFCGRPCCCQAHPCRAFCSRIPSAGRPATGHCSRRWWQPICHRWRQPCRCCTWMHYTAGMPGHALPHHCQHLAVIDDLRTCSRELQPSPTTRMLSCAQVKRPSGGTPVRHRG